jgi:hypothetical protein
LKNYGQKYSDCNEKKARIDPSTSAFSLLQITIDTIASMYRGICGISGANPTIFEFTATTPCVVVG